VTRENKIVIIIIIIIIYSMARPEDADGEEGP